MKWPDVKAIRAKLHVSQEIYQRYGNQRGYDQKLENQASQPYWVDD
jgi:hypothetical protein|tara:strand:+ start:1295 stop:1432 length:138 start_codon:yes stop_codon:yes gene_type:complete